MSNHRLRNRLNKASLALHLLQRQLEVGLRQEADKTLEKVLAEFQLLDDDMGIDSSRAIIHGGLWSWKTMRMKANYLPAFYE
jgi:hypothetical protein